MRTRLWMHFWAALILLIPLGAQAVQDGAINDAGDIAFVAYHDNDDGFSFVLMDDAPHNTSIRFIDDEWTGAAFSSPTGEGDVLWTNNTGSTITKGTVVDIVDADDNAAGITPSVGTAAETDLGFSTANGDQIYAITGTRATPGTFLAFVGESQDINGAEIAVLTNTGLTAGTHAKLIATEGYYSGSTACNSTVLACLQQINGATWIGTAGFSYPADSPSAFSGSVFASDSTPPAVTSITLSGSPASSATSVTLTVSFDENANNISTDDFSVTTVSGSATGSVASVSASSGTSITVTVNSITGVGSIRLDLKASTNITDDTGNGNGTNGSVATFTTGGTHTVSILDSDASLVASGGVTEPVAIDTTVDSTGEAANVFDFTLSDGGTSDGNALIVSQIVLNVSGSATDADRAKVTWRLNGPDASNVIGSYSAGADTITFSGLSISVADGLSENYTVNAYYNDNTGLTEGLTYILSVDGDTDLTLGSGTQMGATSAISNSTGSTVDVVATELAFTTQPAGSVSGATLTTQPVVTARDAFGNTDTGFTETITLTEASAGSLSGNTKAASAGVATFTAVNYTATADQQSFTLTADDDAGTGSDLSTVDASAVTSDVVATKLVFTTQPVPLSVNSGEAKAFTTVPVVSAQDANNIVDTGYSTGIALAEVNGAGSTTMTVTGDTDGDGATVTITPTSGVSTFTSMSITYTASGGASENFNLQASSGGLSTANSSQLTGLVADSDGSLTAAGGVTEPVAIDSTLDTTGEAVNVFDFTLSDGGTSDGNALTVSQVVLNVTGTASDTQRANVTWRLNGADASNVTGSYNSGADTITFSGLSISVADGASEVYTVNAYYNDNTGLTEGLTYILSVDGDSDVIVGAGTQMGATSAITNSTGSTVDVVATTLAFTTQPAGSVSGSALSTQPVVIARDAFGNTDTGFTETVTLTEASAGTLSGNTVAAVSGVATFTALNYSATADQQSFTLTANDQDGVGSDLPTANASAVTTDVVATKLVFDTQPIPLSVNNGESKAFTTVPVVSAKDANNVIDTGYSTGITLVEVNGAGSATLTGTGDTDGSGATVTLTPSSGLATFTGLNITYTASGGSSENFNIQASSGGLSTSNSSQLIGLVADSDGSLTAAAGVTEPVAINTAVDTVGEANDVFDFTLSDSGSADGLAMTVSQIVVNVSGTSSDTQRDNVTWRLNGADASNVTGTYSAGADTITFSGLSISIADGSSEIYTINAYYNDNTGLTEGLTYILSVDGDSDVIVGAGTQMGATSAITNSTGSTVDVVATTLAFTTQPAGSVSGSALSTQPVVIARDAFGNTDTGFTETVTLTEASAGTLSGNTVAAVSGVATFTALNYSATADQQSFTLTANDDDGSGSNLPTINANAVTSDVVASKLVFDTQPAPLTLNSAVAEAMTTVPVVSARDANNVLDTGYTTGITLAEVNGAGSAIMSGTADTDGSSATVTITPTAGVSTFSGLTINYTASGAAENFNLQASSGVLSTSNSSQFLANTDTVNPRISDIFRAIPTNSPTNVDSLTWTIAFNEVVNNFDVTDVEVTGTTATVQSITPIGSSVYRVTVSGGDLATLNGTATLAIASSHNIADEAGNALTNLVPTVQNVNTFVVDNSEPTVAISGVPANSNAAFTATFTFSEAVTGFDVTDITLGNATKGTFTAASSAVYTLVVTPTGTAVTVDVTANGAIDVASNGNTAATQASSAFDNAAPTVAISGVPANSNAAFTATFTFSEVVTGFDATDITLGNATKGTFTATSSTVYTLVVAPTGAAVTVDVAANGASDASGNDNTAATQATSTFDNAAPTVAITGVPVNSNAAFTATFTFSEAVTGFDATDITLGNATKGAFTATSSTVYTLVVTPTGAAVTVDVAANSAIDIASNGNTAATQATANYDATVPTVVISGVPANSNAPFTATFTFSEGVTGFDATDITLGNATKGAFTATSSTVYTLLVTPTGAAVTVDVAANGAIDVASNGNTAATQATTNYDATDPTVVISGVPANSNAAFTATFTFSEAVTGFDATDITLGNATKGTFTATSSTVYTLVVAPTGAAVTVDVAANGASDASGNDNTAATQATSTFDNAAPTVAITGVPVNSNAAFTATFTFSEAVTGFDATDITLGNATKGAFTATSSTVYTLVVTPTGAAVTVDVAANGAIDIASNGNTAAAQATTSYDATDPTVVISGVPMNSNAPFTATFTFSEGVTGFDATDIALGNATKGAFTATSSTVYTLLVTPTGAAVTVDVAANGAIDVASNGNTAATQATANYDATVPTVVISGVPANSNAPFTATFTFSEGVTGFDATDITLGNATKGAFTATSSTVYTLLVTPTGAAVTVDVAANGAIDVASNGNTAATQATTNYDATDPTVVISGVPANSNAAFTATFTFSEAVTGFDATDITLGNATKGTFTATSSTVYTLVVAPTGAAVTVDVAANGASDASGNDNTAATQATSTFDNAAPTVAITGVPVNSNAAFTATFTFSEAVTGFDATDIALGNATKGAFTATSSTVYILVVTPTGAAVTVDVAANGAIDIASNGNTAATQATANYDATVPTVVISGVPANSNAPFTATFTFSEGVTGFDATDITLGNATKGAFTATSSTVYTLLVTPTGAAVTVDVAANGAIDVASNGNTAATQATTNYDATDPTVVISGVPANSNAAFTTIFTFSEAVTGFDAADIALGNATKGTFTAISSTVYTLVITPTGAAVTVDVAANGAIDIASNGNTAATQTRSAFDNAAPTVAITGVPVNSNAAFTATFTFSEAVTGFDATDITLGNATKGTFTATSSTVYTLVVTPTGAAVTVDVAANGAIDVASNGNTAATQATTSYDATDPTVVISGVPANSNAAFTATFTFSEAVTGFDATDIALGNATKGTFTATSSTVYTLVVTPTGAAVTLDVAANGAIDVASNGNTAATQATTSYDATDPTVVISGVPADTNAAFTATFTFSEAVTGFDATDITLGNATKGTFTATSSTVYTLVVTPTGAAVTVDVAANRAIDVANNGNTAATQASSAFDNEAPTLAIGAPSVTTTRNGPVTYTLSYANADNITLALNNITLNKTGDADGTFALSGTDNNRTVTISDIRGDGTLAISIAANSASDKAGNNAAAANSATVTVVSNQAGILSISGNTVVGETLTTSLADVDGLTDITVAYQWTSGGNNVGTSVGSYTLQTSDVGKNISVNAQYTDQRGTAENINSSATDAVITTQSDAVNRISSTADQSGGTEPTVDDYKTAGISDVSDVVLTRILPLINNAVARQSDSADVDDVTKLQALVDTILEGQDNDGDGLPNLVEGTEDTDNDGITDREDTDSDNDGVADQLEVRLTLTDSDSDGIIDVLDADVGNDGQVDTDKVDANFDGVNDALDSMAKLIAKSHANAQAIPAVVDEAELSFIQFDQDQDQRPNHLDLDSDNDGVMDVVESGLSDINGDGKLDVGDTVITDGSQLLDDDADSLPNMLELKSDGISFDLIVNGLPDTLDKDANGILDSTIDMDRDGIIDSVDNAVGAQGTLPDMDGDGIPNHADDDDDGDGILDVDENPQQQYFTGLDADADGIDDGVDQNINGVLEGTDTNNNGVRDDRELADLDGDGIADYLDTDSDNDGVLDGQDIIVNVGYDVKSRGTGEMSIMMMLSLLLLSTLRYSRNIFRISTVLLLFLGAGVSHAQSWQVSLGLGQSILRPDLASGLDTRDGSDWAVQLGLGYRILPDWQVELRYSDLGEADIRGDQGRSALGYQAWVLNAKYQLPLLQGTAWSPYILGGIAVNRLRAEDLKLEKKTDPSLMFGTGISYRFQEFQLNSELIRYSYDNAGWFIGIEKDF